MAITAAVVAVAGTAYSIDQSNKAAKKQEKAQQIQQNQQTSEQRQANVQAERKRRIAASRLQQSAENTGVAGSSGVLNAIGGAQTIQAQGMAFNSQRAQTAGAIGAQLSSARDNQLQAQIGQGFAQLGSTIFASEGGFADVFSSGSGG